ncbi:MAG: hypothetical protein P4L75_00010 [Clostridia bacterium]|nr:hypothetical protein [Clostridia bacterium]
MSNLNETFKKLLADLGVGVEAPCTPEEIEEFIRRIDAGEPLPEDVAEDKGTGAFYHKNNFSDDELRMLLQLQQTKYLRTLKDCAVFFTALEVISLCITFFVFVIH